MKKIISLLLVFSLIFVLMAPVAGAAENERLPRIFIRGNGVELYNGDGTPLTSGLDNMDFLGGGESEGAEETKDKIVEAAVNILKPFVLEGMLFDEWDNYGKAVYEEIAPLFGENAALDENGNAKNGSGVSPSDLAASENNSKSAALYNSNQDYYFCYDWRLSPYDHVDRLHEYVQNIMDATGKSQVNMYARCIGGSLLMAYLERYGHLGHVKNVMFSDVLSNESTVISKAMSGKVEFDAAFLEKYMAQLDYCGRINMGTGFVFTDTLNEIVFKTMDFFNQISVTDNALDGVERLYSRLYEALIPAIMHASGMATQINYWTCVAEEDMDAALNLMFPDNEDGIREKYSGLIDKILYYREHISSDLDGFYDGLKEDGIHFGFLAKYGFLNAPFTEERYLISDSLVSVEHAAYGATTAPVGSTLSAEYINARIEEGNGKYISPDKTIDLSTAYSPDTTWIVKNAHHSVFYDLNGIMREFLDGTNETVDTVTCAEQFMVYDFDEEAKVGTLSVMNEENCIDLEFMSVGNVKTTPFSILTAFFNFISMLIDLFDSIFKGEFDLGSLFG